MLKSDRSLASAAATIPTQNTSLKAATQTDLSALLDRCRRRFYGVIAPCFERSNAEDSNAESSQTSTTQPQTVVNARRLLTSLLMPILWLKCCEEQGSLAPDTLHDVGQQSNAYPSLCRLLHRLSVSQQSYDSQFSNRLPPAALNQAVQALVATIHNSNLDQLSQSIVPKGLGSRCRSKQRGFSRKALSRTLLLGHVYESLLGASASTDRPCRSQSPLAPKSQGQYYTPISIVEGMLDRTLGRLLPPPSQISDHGRSHIPHPSTGRFTLLDPACGAGIFLVMAYQQILDAFSQSPPSHPSQDSQSLTFEAKKTLLLEHLYGVDLDPQAVYVTQLSVWLMLLEGERLDEVTLPDLSRNIQWGNALVGPDIEQQVILSPEQRDRLQPFDWSTAFPQIFGGDSTLRSPDHGFDIVIGNPPYVDAEWMTVHQPEVRRYCSRHYASASGNWDLFCVFCEKALQLCRTGGISSLIVPNKLAAADYAQKTRHLLAIDNRLLSLRDYSAVSVFSIAVYPLVYVVQKLAHKNRTDKHHAEPQARTSSIVSSPSSSTASSQKVKIQWERVMALATGDRAPVLEQRSLSYAEVCHGQRPWAIATTPLLQTLVTRLHHMGIPLHQLATIVGAATVAEAYALKPLILEKTLLDKTLLEKSPLEQVSLEKTFLEKPRADFQAFKFINSGTIDPYQFLWGQKPVRYLKTKYAAPVVSFSHQPQIPAKRWLQAESAKIVVAGMTLILECALDATGEIFPGKSTTVIRSSHDLRYLLALLNSRLMGVYYRTEFGGNALNGGYLRIGPPQIKQLPIVMGSDRQQQRLIRLVDALHTELTANVDTANSDTANSGLASSGLANSGKTKAGTKKSRQAKSRPANASREKSSNNQHSKQLRHQIDQQVYQIYGLSTEEICLIEHYELP